MARMSIDDKVRRDQRLFDLAEKLGWSPRETFGTIYDIWEMCHDRVSEVLPETLVNNRAFRDAPRGTPVDFDFVGKLIEVGYARRHRSPRMITMIDAIEMIEYLKKSKTSGREGGLKSGETRRNKAKAPTKGRFDDAQGLLNLPDPVPDPPTPPDPVSPSALVDPPDPTAQPARQESPIPPAPSQTEQTDPNTSLTSPRALPGVGSDWSLRNGVWKYQLERHRALRDRGIEPNALDLLGAPAGIVERQMQDCIKYLRNSKYPEDALEAKMRNAIDVTEAECIRDNTLDYFKPVMIWDDKRFARSVDTTPAQALRPRGSQRLHQHANQPHTQRSGMSFTEIGLEVAAELEAEAAAKRKKDP